MTQVGYGPPQRVDGPPPIRPLYGLLQAAEAPAAGVRVVPEPDDRWMNGVEVYPYPLDVPDVYDPCAPGSVSTTMGYGTDVKHPDFGALTVWLAESCKSYKIWDQDEFKARAVAVLGATESYGVAHELLTGVRIPGNPHLADGNGVFPNADTPTSIANGVALLEREIAKSGRLGLIHCSPQVLTMGARNYFGFDSKTGVIRTLNGIPVIPDFGYQAGASPTAHAAASGTQEWIYATGPIDIRRSEVFTMPETVEEALDRGMAASDGHTNVIAYRVERYYVVDWDTEVQAAVLIDRCSSSIC